MFVAEVADCGRGCFAIFAKQIERFSLGDTCVFGGVLRVELCDGVPCDVYDGLAGGDGVGEFNFNGVDRRDVGGLRSASVRHDSCRAAANDESAGGERCFGSVD